MTEVGAVGVRYEMVQSTGSPKRRPGVYITDLDVGNFADGDPGLYKVSRGQRTWEVQVRPVPTIQTDFAAINGLCDGLKDRSEEHTSELQSRGHLVCRLLLEKKK